MVLSAAINNGYYFLVIIAISTSIIGGVYYLNLVKEIYFFSPYVLQNKILSKKLKFENNLFENKKELYNNIKLSSPISITISIITLIILLFIFINKE
jgi:NADH-ubiquinone oxidoreductase chain 2